MEESRWINGEVNKVIKEREEEKKRRS